MKNLLYTSVDTISPRAFHEQANDFMLEPNSWENDLQTEVESAQKYQ